MFDQLLLDAVTRRAAARAWTLPFAAAVHVVIVAAAVAASYAVVTAIDPEPITVVAQPSFGAIPEPPPGTGGPARPAPHATAPLRTTHEPQQPVAAPASVVLDAPPEGVPAPDGIDANDGERGGGGTPCIGLNCVPGSDGHDPNGVLGAIGTGGGGYGADLVLPPPVEVEGQVRPPRLVTKIEPQYPEIARRIRLEGRVVLRAIIGTGGDVEEISVVRSVPLLDEAAIEAVRRWRYEPAALDGRPIRVWFMVAVLFRLE